MFYFYPLIFFLPGLILSGAGIGSSGQPLVNLSALVVSFIVMLMARFRLLMIALTVLLFLLLGLEGRSGLQSAGLLIAGSLLLFLAGSFRCPRCLILPPRDNSWRKGPAGGYCYICGRDRRRVWPLQYALKPETWDGEYHDEGGGPSSVDSIVDWWRDLAYKRWQKRHRHFQ